MGSFECYCALCSGPTDLYSIKLGSSKARHLARRKKRVENQRRRQNGEDVMHEDSKEWREAEKKEDELARAAENDKDEEMKDAATTEPENDSEKREDQHVDGEEGMEGQWEDDDFDEGNEQDESSDQGSEHDDDNNEEENTENVQNLEENEDDFSDHVSQASELEIQEGYDMAEESKDDTHSMFDYNEHHSYDPTKLNRDDVQWVDRSRALSINRALEGKKKAFLSGRGRYDYVCTSCVLLILHSYIANNV